MSQTSDRLARNRAAILDHIARRERRHDPREVPAGGYPPGYASPGDSQREPSVGAGWFAHMRHALSDWWRYHPAHMAVEFTSPLMRSYARRRPVQLLGISLAAGAVLMLARPWRLISLTTLAIALVKSSDLPRLLMATMSAADYRKDADHPE